MTLCRIIPVYNLAWPFREEVFKVCRNQICVAHPPPLDAKNVSLGSDKLGNTHPVSVFPSFLPCAPQVLQQGQEWLQKGCLFTPEGHGSTQVGRNRWMFRPIHCG